MRLTAVNRNKVFICMYLYLHPLKTKIFQLYVAFMIYVTYNFKKFAKLQIFSLHFIFGGTPLIHLLFSVVINETILRMVVGETIQLTQSKGKYCG